MSNKTILLFWILWLFDVLLFIFGHREFINGMFGRYASPSFKQVWIWVVLLTVILVILYVSLEFKNQGRGSTALNVAAIPLVLVLPYALWVAMVIISGRSTNWR